jgi:hypothetical protein
LGIKVGTKLANTIKGIMNFKNQTPKGARTVLAKTSAFANTSRN